MLVGEMGGPFADVCPIKLLATSSAMFVVTDADNTTSSWYRSARRLAKPMNPHHFVLAQAMDFRAVLPGGEEKSSPISESLPQEVKRAVKEKTSKAVKHRLASPSWPLRPNLARIKKLFIEKQIHCRKLRRINPWLQRKKRGF